MKFYSSRIPQCFFYKELSLDDFLGREGEEGKFYKAVYDVLSDFGVINSVKIMNEAYRACVSIYSIKGYAEKYNYRWNENSFSYSYGAAKGSNLRTEFLVSMFIYHKNRDNDRNYAIERLYKNIYNLMEEIELPYEELFEFYSKDFPTYVDIDFSPNPDIKAIRKSLRNDDFDWEEITDGFDEEIIAEILELCPEELRQDVEADIEKAHYPSSEKDENASEHIAVQPDIQEQIAKSVNAQNERIAQLEAQMKSMQEQLNEANDKLNALTSDGTPLLSYFGGDNGTVLEVRQLLASCTSTDLFLNVRPKILDFLKNKGKHENPAAIFSSLPFLRVVVLYLSYKIQPDSLQKSLSRRY